MNNLLWWKGFAVKKWYDKFLMGLVGNRIHKRGVRG